MKRNAKTKRKPDTGTGNKTENWELNHMKRNAKRDRNWERSRAEPKTKTIGATKENRTAKLIQSPERLSPEAPL